MVNAHLTHPMSLMTIKQDRLWDYLVDVVKKEENVIETKNEPKKMNTHIALNDIKESINELKWYKENYFKL